MLFLSHQQLVQPKGTGLHFVSSIASENRLLNDRVELVFNFIYYWNLRMLKSMPDFPGSNTGGDENSGGDDDAETVETVEDEACGEDDEEDVYTYS
jgi:hypothetical protein